MSFRDATDLYPHFVEQIISKLAQSRKDLTPEQVSWALVSCRDDPDQPLTETAAADLLLTGKQYGRKGICGRIGRHFACYCEDGCEQAESHD